MSASRCWRGRLHAAVGPQLVGAAAALAPVRLSTARRVRYTSERCGPCGHGGGAERFNAAVLKTAGRKSRGFESLPLRRFRSRASSTLEGSHSGLVHPPAKRESG